MTQWSTSDPVFWWAHAVSGLQSYFCSCEKGCDLACSMHGQVDRTSSLLWNHCFPLQCLSLRGTLCWDPAMISCRQMSPLLPVLCLLPPLRHMARPRHSLTHRGAVVNVWGTAVEARSGSNCQLLWPCPCALKTRGTQPAVGAPVVSTAAWGTRRDFFMIHPLRAASWVFSAAAAAFWLLSTASGMQSVTYFPTLHDSL